MVFVKCLPRNCEHLKHQTKLSSVSDSEFNAAYAEPVFSCGDRFVQLLLFIFGLGWLRLIFLFVVTIVYVILMTPVTVFAEYPRVIRFWVGYGTYISQKYIRALAFLFGIWYISVDGKIDKEARGFIYNHSSILDGPLMFIYTPFTIIGMLGIKGVPIFGQIATANGAAFIDRSKQQGNSNVLKSVMEDHSKFPASVAPEGKISNGDILFKFRTGSFLSHERIQPVTIRYTWLMPWAGATHNWIVDTFFEWLWVASCVPFAKVTITYLPTITPEMQEGKSPSEIAEMAQLMMANNLGTLAIDRSSKEIFQKPKETPKITNTTPLLEESSLSVFDNVANQ